MFTIQQIEHAHARVKSGADFPKYFQVIKSLGVIALETYVSDSHTDYYGAGNYHLVSSPKYPVKTIAATANPESFAHSIKIHQQGETDYLTICQQAADAGVYKWKIEMKAMTCTYYDTKGNALLVESIPDVTE